MIKTKELLLLLLLVVPSVIADESGAPSHAALEWNALLNLISEGQVDRYRARDLMAALRPRLDQYYEERGGMRAEKKDWSFPVEGYGYQSIDKYYVVRGFDFFSAVRHGDHPAYDIFIKDRDHDCLDDRTGKPVNVLSMSAGVVVGRRTGWLPGSPYRGGNCVWVYDPMTKGLFYYAHLNTVQVELGDILGPGMVVGTIGRSGKNAWQKRSPTHLHIMCLSYPASGIPYPQKFYGDLVNSRLKIYETPRPVAAAPSPSSAGLP